MNIDRIQGLINWYPQKDKNTIMAMARYWLDQKAITSEEYAQIEAGIDLQASSGTKIDIKAMVEENASLRAEKAVLETENAMLKKGGNVGGKT
jgi:hypothetical protein